MLFLKKQFWIVILALSVTAAMAFADITKESTTRMDFKGGLGTIMKLFGMEKPVRSIEYLKGDAFRTDRVDSKSKVEHSTIVDLEKETFTTIDHKKKEYTVMTFAEWKQMIEQGLKDMEQAKGEKSDQPEAEVKWSFDMKVTKSGETKDVAGYATENANIDLNVEAETTQKPENGGEARTTKGGLKVKSVNWMAKSLSGNDEIMAFNKKLAEKLGFAPGKGGMAEILSTVMKNNPQLGAAMEKMQEESAKLKGVPLEVHTVFETWGEKPQVKEEEESLTEVPTSIGGLMKGFGKKKQPDENPNVLLETTVIVQKYDTQPLADDLSQIPAKFKEKKYSPKK